MTRMLVRESMTDLESSPITPQEGRFEGGEGDRCVYSWYSSAGQYPEAVSGVSGQF